MKWTMAVAVVGLISGATAPVAAQTVFRSSVESVMVDVSVRERGREVTDFTAADFELRDNGRVQRIGDISREVMPIDVTFVVDLSGSVQGPLFDAIKRAIASVDQRLRPIDRTSVVTFNHRVREVRAMAEGTAADAALGAPVGQTSLFDAVTLALVAPREPGRRRMAIIFTDGQDGSSFADAASLVELARRSEMAVFTVALAAGTERRPQRAAHEEVFAELAATTGGAIAVLQQGQDLGPSFVQAFDDFRTSYVLRYIYEGPREPGWHTLAVKVLRRGQYEVRARQGYFVGD